MLTEDIPQFNLPEIYNGTVLLMMMYHMYIIMHQML